MLRRLARREREPLPDLFLVDGGRGQLGVVLAALHDAGVEADCLGIAKERDRESPSPRVKRDRGLKAERLFLPGRANPVLLPPSSRGLLLLQKIRDEAHRFAIGFQRDLRQRTHLRSVLEEIPGIGPGKRRALLQKLGSLRAVREASAEVLAGVPGLSARDVEALRRFFAAIPAAPGPSEGEPGAEGE
jgi:excinuclease ABC subunit C